MRSKTAPKIPSLILAGGGLANSLIAYRLAQKRPEIPVTVVEGQDRLGGQHTWSFFLSDLGSAGHWITPFVVKSWPKYDVRFPSGARSISNTYCSVVSDRLHDVVMSVYKGETRFGAKVASLNDGGVELTDGRRLEADVVIDGRGATDCPDLSLGYQKFLGRTVLLEADHGLEGPIVMDATVPQIDGYRFIYVLPWTARTLLIEDTRYSDSPSLGRDAIRQAISAYALSQGWRVKDVLGEEEGVLPVALDGDIEAHWARKGGLAASGLRAALFHPTTGYSLPDAVNLADAICALPEITSLAVEALIRTRSIALWKERAVFRLLNRMLFRAGKPEKRYLVLERFYRMREPLIRRFYAANLTRFDKARLLVGKPPVPFGAALACISEKGRP